jgi:hypothetical protein
LSPTAIEAALGRNDWKEIAVRLPVAQHLSFYMPTPAFAHQGQGEQFTVTALRGWARSAECGSDFLENVIHDYVHPQAKISKVVYHGVVLQRDLVVSTTFPYHAWGLFVKSELA